MDDTLRLIQALNERREDLALEMLRDRAPSAPLTQDEQTALHLAARFGCPRVVRALLDRSAPSRPGPTRG
jgi:ankyrin repeat protein